jgi:hypothetical protein
MYTLEPAGNLSELFDSQGVPYTTAWWSLVDLGEREPLARLVAVDHEPDSDGS